MYYIVLLLYYRLIRVVVVVVVVVVDHHVMIFLIGTYFNLRPRSGVKFKSLLIYVYMSILRIMSQLIEQSCSCFSVCSAKDVVLCF